MLAKPTLSVRAPKNLDEFVHGPDRTLDRTLERSDRPTDNFPSAPPPPPPAAREEPPPPISASSSEIKRPKIRGVVARKGGEERARVTVYLSVRAATRLRQHCFDSGVELSEVAGHWIEERVKEL